MDILLDFDGTVVTHDFPNLGKDVGAAPVLKQLIKEGHRLILFTMRSDRVEGEYLKDAVKWFKVNNIPLYGVQSNPTQKEWTDSPKAYGQLIIDDIGLGIPLTYQYGELKDSRPFVDWREVNNMLIERGILKSQLNGVGDRNRIITTVLTHFNNGKEEWFSFSYCQRTDSITIQWDREKWYDNLPIDRRQDHQREVILQEIWKWERTRTWQKLRCTLTAQKYWERKGGVISADSLIEKVNQKLKKYSVSIDNEYTRIINEKL